MLQVFDNLKQIQTIAPKIPDTVVSTRIKSIYSRYNDNTLVISSHSQRSINKRLRIEVSWSIILTTFMVTFQMYFIVFSGFPVAHLSES